MIKGIAVSFCPERLITKIINFFKKQLKSKGGLLIKKVFCDKFKL